MLLALSVCSVAAVGCLATVGTPAKTRMTTSEIFDSSKPGIVRIESAAREPGARAKIAVDEHFHDDGDEYGDGGRLLDRHSKRFSYFLVDRFPCCLFIKLHSSTEKEIGINVAKRNSGKAL